MTLLLRLRALLMAAALFLALCPVAQAQLVDEVEVRREGPDAVVRVRFATEVQYARSLTTRSGDLTLVFYNIVGSEGDAAPRATLLRRLGAADGLPEVSVFDEQDRGRSRKLVLRFAAPTRVAPRAGPGNRALDVVFPGMGSAVDRARSGGAALAVPGVVRSVPAPAPAVAVPAPAPAPSVTAPAAAAPAAPAPVASLAAGRYVINLQRSAQPDLQLSRPIPSSMQDYTVFSARRVVEGATLYEINLGYFENRAKADQALRQLRARFPQAAVVDTAPAVAAAAPALAPATPPAKAGTPGEGLPGVTAPTLPLPAAPLPPASPPVAAAPAPSVPVPMPSAAAASAVPAGRTAAVTAPAASAPAAAPAIPAAPTVAVAAAPLAAASAPAVPAVPAAAASAPAPARVAQAEPAPVTAPAPAPVTGADAPRLLDPAQIEQRAGALLNSARQAYERQDYPSAFADLNELLNLPPNTHTRDGQELAGMARLRAGDLALARAEFETYLALYPQGPGADRVRRELAGLPAQAPVPRLVTDTASAESEPTVTGGASLYYYGGNGRFRSQDFKDSPLSGLPEAAGEPLFAPDRTSQLNGHVDLTWRQRDDEQDVRLVVQDTYTADLKDRERNRNRLTSLYADYRAPREGYGLRVGRQSPSGAGNFNRFDGVQAHYAEKRRWKLGVVGGAPSERLFDTKRYFFGMSAEAESLAGSMGGPWGNLGAGVYINQHMIDGEIDRRNTGLELRFFHGGVSVFSQVDYDLMFKAVNIASAQGTWILGEETTFNALLDRRRLTPLALGNALTFLDSNQTTLAATLDERLAQGPTTVEALREQILLITPTVTQAQLGMTHFLSRQWQVGANAQLTRTSEVPPVPGVSGFENGIPATGNIVTVGGQLIGLNLYSPRDTSVASLSLVRSPGLQGWLIGLNNSTIAFDDWQFEPSLQVYLDRADNGGSTRRVTPGLRLTYRGVQRWSMETGLTYEMGRSTVVTVDSTNTRVTSEQSTSRLNYSLGARYEF